jgi:hypothetical protein
MSKEQADRVMMSLEMEDTAAEAQFEALSAEGFCDYWPTVRSGVELLRSNVFTGNGLGNRAIRWAIGEIIEKVNGRCP